MPREDGLKRRMSDAQEAWLADRFGGRVSRGSGNQPTSPMDVRQHHREQEFAVAFEGKSTRGKGITVTEEMWNKAVEQSIGEQPMLALRWYHDDRLRSFTDLLVIDPDDYEALVDAARELKDVKKAIYDSVNRPPVRHPDYNADQ